MTIERPSLSSNVIEELGLVEGIYKDLHKDLLIILTWNIFGCDKGLYCKGLYEWIGQEFLL